MSIALDQVRQEVADHLAAIQRCFKPGAKVTVLVRPNLGPDKDGDFVLSDDRLPDAIAALARRHGGADDRLATFQSAVSKWMVETFGDKIAMDPLERIMRFLEEAMELAQTLGMTEAECGRVASYVWGRPAGEVNNEVGGVMVTLAALCHRQEVDLSAAALGELTRIDTPEMRKRIFEKQAFKRQQGLTSDGGFRAEASV